MGIFTNSGAERLFYGDRRLLKLLVATVVALIILLIAGTASGDCMDVSNAGGLGKGDQTRVLQPVEVESFQAVYSEMEESRRYNTFVVQTKALIREISEQSVSQSDNDEMLTTHHGMVWIQDEETCLYRASFIAERDGIVYAFESLADLEDGTFSDVIGSIEGDVLVFDTAEFEAKLLMVRYEVGKSSGAFGEEGGEASSPVYFDELELHLKRI